jgi:hypothetical protein
VKIWPVDSQVVHRFIHRIRGRPGGVCPHAVYPQFPQADLSTGAEQDGSRSEGWGQPVESLWNPRGIHRLSTDPCTVCTTGRNLWINLGTRCGCNVDKKTYPQAPPIHPRVIPWPSTGGHALRTGKTGAIHSFHRAYYYSCSSSREFLFKTGCVDKSRADRANQPTPKRGKDGDMEERFGHPARPDRFAVTPQISRLFAEPGPATVSRTPLSSPEQSGGQQHAYRNLPPGRCENLGGHEYGAVPTGIGYDCGYVPDPASPFVHSRSHSIGAGRGDAPGWI